MLNATYTPLGVVSWKRAVCLVLDQRAEIIESSDSILRSAGGFSIDLPLVIRLTHMVKMPHQRRQPLTKGALRTRDQGRCQVSGCDKKGNSVDHLIPTSRGGKHEFTNVVLMCSGHNALKGDRTLEEMHWTLKQKPVSPDYKTLLSRHNIDAWDKWIEQRN